MKKLLIRHEQKLRYLIIGGWNTVFGYAVFAALNWGLASVHYLVILTVSYIISITNAYVGYKLFVFRTKGNILKEYLRFYVVYGASFGFNVVALPVLVEGFTMNVYAAQALIIVITIAGSYLLHKHYSFKS